MKKLYRVPFLAITGGEFGLLIVLIATGNLVPLTLKPGLDPVIISLLLVAIGTFMFILFAFIQKYKYNPNRLKRNILVAIGALAATFVFLLMNYTFSVSDNGLASSLTKNFVIDLGTISFLVVTYQFVLFGLDVLISPSVETRFNVIKFFLDIVFLAAYYLNFVAYVKRIIAGADFDSLYDDIGDTLAYLLIFLCAILLAIMAFRSISLQRKAADPRGKAGFRSWTVTFFLIIIDTFLVLLFTLLNEITSTENDVAIIFGLGVVFTTIICSVFIYKGFITPASTRTT